MSPKKLAIVLDEKLSSGIALNSTAHMMMSLGSMTPDVIGKTVVDASSDNNFYFWGCAFRRHSAD